MTRNVYASIVEILPICIFSFTSILIKAFIFLISISLASAQHETMKDITMALPQVRTFIYDSASRPMNGSFSTPAFVAYEKAVYRFHFRAKLDEVVWLYWHDFHLEESVGPNRGCLHNYVEIVVIDYYNEDHVSGRYCGNVTPPNFTTMQKGVDLIFSTSGARFYQGFKGTYRFIPERAVPPPRSFYPGKLNANAAGCGGIAQGHHGGVIKSPGYPNDYPANVDCNWVIRVRQNMKIFIKVLELELTPSITQCDDAQLVVLDGYAHVSNETLPAATNHQRIILCGESKYHNDEGLKSVMSIKNRMNIRFKTSKPPPTETRIRRRDYGSPIGFYLVWTEVSTEETCDKFYCRGGAYCIDEGKKVCADRKRYCIDTSLVCDGIPNCAESDDSDEDNCYSKQIALVSVSIFASLVAVIIFVVCCQRRRARKQLRRAMEREIARRGSFSSASSSTAGGDGSRSSFELTTAVPGKQGGSVMNRRTSQKAEPSSPHEKLVKSDSRTSEVGQHSKKNHLPRNDAGEIVVFPQNRYASKKGKSKDSTDVEMITFPDIEEELKSLKAGVSGRRTSGGVPQQPAVRLISPKLLSKISHKFKSFHEEEMNNNNNNNGDDAETSFSVTERKGYSSVKSKVPYKYPAANKLPKIKILNTSDHNSIWQERRRSSDIRSTGSSSLGGGSGIQNLTPDSDVSDLSPALTSPLWKDFTTDSKGTSELNVIRRRINSNAPFNPSILFSIPSESKSPPPSPGSKDDGNPADAGGQDAFCPRPPPTPLDFGAEENLGANFSSKTIVKLPPGILKQSNLTTTTMTPNTACSNNPKISTYRSTVTVDIPQGYSTTKRTFFEASPQPPHKKPPPPTLPKPILSTSKSLDVAAGKFSFANYPKITRQKAVEFSDQIQSQIIEGSPSSDPDDSTPEQAPAVYGSTTTTTTPPPPENSGPWRQRIKPTIV